ncbi:MAG: hypothetical protein AAF266_07600 [Planctomycetota bacterium]
MNATTRVTNLRVAAAFSIVLACAMAQAGTVSSFTLIDGEGFESPDYSLGILEGQFASTFEGFGSAAWVQSPLGGTSTAVVQDSVVASGSQAVQVDRAASSDDRWAVPITGAPAERFVCIDWDMYVEQSTTTGFGPFFGIEAYDDDATTILRVGSLGVDAATGEILYTLRDDGVLPGFLVPTPGGETVNFNEWNSFRMVLDYATDEAYMFLNNDLLLTTPFEQDGSDQFTDADIAAIAASFDPASVSATGTAYFDNYFVFETNDINKIPEPATVAFLAVALAAASTQRRR